MTEQVEDWLLGLDPDDFNQIAHAIDALQDAGPVLGDPIVKRITNSRHHNMKELRSIGGNLRILFAFDPRRQAILLIGGDKTGQWNRWYEQQIPIADSLYSKHLEQIQ